MRGRLLAATTVAALALCARPGAAQIVLSAGALAVPDALDGTHFGPAAGAELSRTVLGVRWVLEAGLARTDFTSLGQDYHDNHYFFSLGTEWFPIEGRTRVGLKVGLGAHGQYQIVEALSSPGGENWVEAVVPGLVVERRMGDRRVVVTLTDYVLGPWFAILDPEEYGIEHRIRLMVGIRFGA